MADTVFVQPHFDDIALSCGGTVASLAETGEPVIVTIFGGEPEATTSDFARFQHARWQLSDDTVIRMRRAEDESAARALGETVSVLWLDYADAIYRDDGYSSDDALFGDLSPSDVSLVDRIAGDLMTLGDTFVVPLAVGNHVDHQLAFLAGEVLRARGRDVWLYADLPYALDGAATRQRLDALGDPEACVRHIKPEQFDRRWRAIECYASQLPVLFRNIREPRPRFEQFGRELSDRLPVELFWNMDAIERQD